MAISCQALVMQEIGFLGLSRNTIEKCCFDQAAFFYAYSILKANDFTVFCFLWHSVRPSADALNKVELRTLRESAKREYDFFLLARLSCLKDGHCKNTR